jgi:hypothetical protein
MAQLNIKFSNGRETGAVGGTACRMSSSQDLRANMSSLCEMWDMGRQVQFENRLLSYRLTSEVALPVWTQKRKKSESLNVAVLYIHQESAGHDRQKRWVHSLRHVIESVNYDDETDLIAPQPIAPRN